MNVLVSTIDDRPQSGSLTSTASRSRCASRTATVPSVLAPSITTCSRCAYDCAATEARQSATVAAQFQVAVMMEIFTVSSSDMSRSSPRSRCWHRRVWNEATVRAMAKLAISAVHEEFTHRHANVSHDLAEQDRRNVTTLMERNCRSATVCVSELLNDHLAALSHETQDAQEWRRPPLA